MKKDWPVAVWRVFFIYFCNCCIWPQKWQTIPKGELWFDKNSRNCNLKLMLITKTKNILAAYVKIIEWFVILQVILFEIDCIIFYTHLHELFCQFISWTNWVNSSKFNDNCWTSYQVMAGLNKVYDDFIIINLYCRLLFFPVHIKIIVICYVMINKGNNIKLLLLILARPNW